ncbi:MAG: LysM peptidoglycan-binding domain-containing protein [Acidimicrobiia bacterium]|nr:LysM peptidoglycan-binding domain-containing protein [Acidimicrobiia bacterium]
MSHARPRRRITLIALTVVLALVLTSCFGEDDPDSTTTTTSQESSTSPSPQDAPTTTQAVVIETPTTTQAIVIETPTTTQAIVIETPTPPPTEPVVGDDGILLYTVQAGDTLFSIAQRFGVSLDAVIEANNISNPDVIFEGDTLTIPPAG